MKFDVPYCNLSLLLESVYYSVPHHSPNLEYNIEKLRSLVTFFL